MLESVPELVDEVPLESAGAVVDPLAEAAVVGGAELVVAELEELTVELLGAVDATTFPDELGGLVVVVDGVGAGDVVVGAIPALELPDVAWERFAGEPVETTDCERAAVAPARWGVDDPGERAMAERDDQLGRNHHSEPQQEPSAPSEPPPVCRRGVQEPPVAAPGLTAPGIGGLTVPEDAGLTVPGIGGWGVIALSAAAKP